MSGLSSNGEALAFAGVFNGGRYLSLHSAAPDDTGSNEIAAGGYARIAQSTFDEAGHDPSVWTNHADLVYAIATADWNTIAYVGVWSASTVGTFYGAWPVSVAKNILNGDICRIPAGSLAVSVD